MPNIVFRAIVMLKHVATVVFRRVRSVSNWMKPAKKPTKYLSAYTTVENAITAYSTKTDLRMTNWS